ncbi:MAG: hypothetical protein ACLUAR_12805 [Pilosibacter sp.]
MRMVEGSTNLPAREAAKLGKIVDPAKREESREAQDIRESLAEESRQIKITRENRSRKRPEPEKYGEMSVRTVK